MSPNKREDEGELNKGEGDVTMEAKVEDVAASQRMPR